MAPRWQFIQTGTKTTIYSQNGSRRQAIHSQNGPRRQFLHKLVPRRQFFHIPKNQFIHKMFPDSNSFTNWFPDGNSFTFPHGSSFTKCSQTAIHSQNGPQTTIHSQYVSQTQRYSQSGSQTAIRLPISACDIIAALLSLIVYTHNNGNYHQHLSLSIPT